ncbi:MAG: galactose-1-epimerase [Lonepinella koalarum]|nr:galactose-1-epimerase [Lonepinella koalarum]
MLKTLEKTTALAPDNQPFIIVTLKNQQGMQVQLMDWGATWISCKVPVQNQLREVLLGCQPQDYPHHSAYMGATIGRYANRIANAQFPLNGKQIKLTANQGKHQLHGGQGFDKRRWQICQDYPKCGENSVRFELFSPDGDEGFQGNVNIAVTYELTAQNEVIISFEAESDKDTPINLTNHAYFNLNNATLGCDVREHSLQLNAKYFLPVDQEGIPNAALKSVENTSFDFRHEKPIGLDFLQEEQCVTKGYDHAFLLDGQQEKTAAILTALDRSIRLEISTSQPALQIYTGNYLQGNPTRTGSEYADYSGIALETQALPDTPNHLEWWQYGGMLNAGESYRHWTKFVFSELL